MQRDIVRVRSTDGFVLVTHRYDAEGSPIGFNYKASTASYALAGLSVLYTGSNVYLSICTDNPVKRAYQRGYSLR